MENRVELYATGSHYLILFDFFFMIAESKKRVESYATGSHYLILFDFFHNCRIEKESGIIRNRKELDREDVEEYELKISATDGGQPHLSSSKSHHDNE